MLKGKIFVLIGLMLIVSIGLTSAAIISDVIIDDLVPGGEGLIRLEIENVLSKDVRDVSLTLDFSDLPITPVGSSEDGTDEIEEGEEEDFVFKIKADNDITPGDYRIPYILRYNDGDEKQRIGSIGVTVNGNPEISFSVSKEMAVVDEKGKITLKVINRGFANAKFVNVRLLPDGFTLLSENVVYIGTVDSDDFETATFDVIFNKENARFIALITYKDFNNNDKEAIVDILLEVYSRERALEIGLIKKSNALFYIVIAVVVIILWFVYRSIRKRGRIKKSLGR